MRTLVEVGECFLVQFDGRRGRCTQNILKGKDLVFIVWGQAGLLLLEDWQGKNIAGNIRDKKKSEMLVGHKVYLTFLVNTIQSNKHISQRTAWSAVNYIYKHLPSVSIYLSFTSHIYSMAAEQLKAHSGEQTLQLKERGKCRCLIPSVL